MNMLVVVAHPDDEVLIAGASIAMWTSQGAKITAAILCGQAGARERRPEDEQLQKDVERARSLLGMEPPILGEFPNIAMNAIPHLELVQFIEAAMVQTGANTIITHHPGDINDDHRQTSRACQAAARLPQRRGGRAVKGLFYGEVLSSTDWAFKSDTRPFEPTAFTAVSVDHVERKLEALAAYRDVMRPHPHPRSDEAVGALATLRGSQAGVERAEAFEIAHFDATELAL